MIGNKKKPLMGKILVTSGLSLKIIQMIFISCGVEAMGGAVATAITAVLLAGGLAVYSLERRYFGTVPLFGVICAIATLLSVINSETSFFPFLIFVLTYASFGIMLISFGERKRKLCGMGVILLGIVLSVLSVKGAKTGVVATTVLLSIMYGLMAVGMYI